jgi:uncharacterized Zn finger protein (UPF0148 family)
MSKEPCEECGLPQGTDRATTYCDACGRLVIISRIGHADGKHSGKIVQIGPTEWVTREWAVAR